jgi:tRNA U34 5-carboxymethylaminomethyl modifying GTPase MnmE/TrmE
LLASSEPTYFLADFDLNWCNRQIEVGVYYWPTQRSFTGEPCAELHLVGSSPIVQRILDRLHQLGAYPADRGEFALRSFLAGKLDLVQAEAVLGVIQSVHGQQLHWALSQLGGNLSRAVQGLRNEIVELLARLEAVLDFVDYISRIAPANRENIRPDCGIGRAARGTRRSKPATGIGVSRVAQRRQEFTV